MRLAATSTVIAGVLATAALASPLASARPDLDPPTSHARSSATAPADLPNPNQQSRHVRQVGPPILQPATATPQPEVHRDQWAAPYASVYSRPDKSLIPVSQQERQRGVRPSDFMPAGKHAPAAVYSRPDKSLAQQERQRVAALSAYRQGQLATALGIAATAANKASPPKAIVRVNTPQSGFDWGDAGIGAAGGLVIALLIIGGAVLVTRHRQPNPNRAKVLA